MKGLKLGKITVKAVLLTITIVMAVLMLMSAWGGVVDPNTSTLFSMLTLGMPIVLIVNLVILVMWLLLFRWRYALIPLVAVLLSWGPISTVCPLNVFAKNYDVDSTFTVMSYNVANFDYTNQDKPSKPMRHILDRDADLVLMQEGSQERNYLTVPNVIGMRDEIIQKYPYRSSGYRDLVILSKYPYTVVSDSAFETNPTQQITRREVNVNNRNNLQRIKHSLYDKLGRAFVRHAEEAHIIRTLIDNGPANVIVCGDFNEAPSSYCYRTLRGDDLSDAFQDCGCGFTYTFNANRMYFKIDHILYRGAMETVDWSIAKVPDSDHYPQMATFIWK